MRPAHPASRDHGKTGHHLELEDVAYAYKDDKGKVRIHQAISLAR